MSTEKSSQTHKSFEFVNNMVDGQIDRMNSWLEQMEKWQKEGFERTEAAIDEAADLSKTTLDYVQRLSEEWREMGMETLRQTSETLKTDE